jgi:hypothetical protein
LQRKIGALQESVVSILQNKIQRSYHQSNRNKGEMHAVEASLRQATGLIEETRRTCEREIQKMGSNNPDIFFKAAVSVIDPPSQNAYSGNEPNDIIHTVFLGAVHEQAKTIQGLVETLALRLQDELVKSAEDLAITNTPDKDEFLSFIRDMPVFDPGTIFVTTQKPGYAVLLGKRFAEKELARQFHRQIGESFEKALSNYLKFLKEWTEAVMGQIGQQFETYAELYRTQAELSSSKYKLTPDDIQAIEKDLILLGGSVSSNGVGAGNSYFLH